MIVFGAGTETSHFTHDEGLRRGEMLYDVCGPKARNVARAPSTRCLPLTDIGNTMEML